jgi:hypothetical protein
MSDFAKCLTIRKTRCRLTKIKYWVWKNWESKVWWCKNVDGYTILITNFNILINLILKIYNKAVIFYQNKEDKQLNIFNIILLVSIR